MRALPEFLGDLTRRKGIADRSIATHPAGRRAWSAAEPSRCQPVASPTILSQLKETEMVNKDQVRGAMKEAAGKATGNRRTEAEGKADKIAGKVQKGFGDVKEKIKDSL